MDTTNKGFKAIIKSQDFIAICILTLTTAIFFHEQIFLGQYFWSGYWSDITEVSAAFVELNAQAFADFEIPFWNPYSYGGIPHLADPLTAYFYPLHFVGYLFMSMGMTAFTWMLIMIIFHFWLMQVGMYYLLKQLKLSLFPCLFGAIAFTYSAAVTATYMFPNFVFNFAYLPFIVLFFLRLLRQKNLQATAMFIVICAFSFFGGNPNIMFFIAIYLAVIWAVWAWHIRAIGRAKFIFPTIKLLGLAAIILLLFLSPQLLETFDFIPFSQRDNIGYKFASDASLKWQQLATIISPKIFGFYSEADQSYLYWLTPNRIYHYWETAFYFGVPTFILAFVGFYNYRKRLLIKAGILISIFSLAYALGDNFILFKFLFEFIPGFDNFRIPSRILFLLVFSFSIASAYGLEKVMDGYSKKTSAPKILLPLVSASILVLIAWIYASNLTGGPKGLNKINNPYIMKGAIYLIGSLLLSIPSIYKRHKFQWLTGLLFIVLIFVDLSSVQKKYKNSPADPDLIYTPDREKYAQFFPKTNNEFFRVAPENRKYRLLKRNQGVFMQIYNNDGLYSVQKKLNLPSGIPYSDLLSVRFLVAPVMENNAFTGRFQLKPQRNAHRYARLVYDYEVEKEEEHDLSTFPFASSVILEDASSTSYSKELPSEVSHSVNISSLKRNSKRIKVSTDKNAILVLSEYYYPGWKATLDGESVELIKANYWQQAVEIPKGEHELYIEYNKTKFNIAFLIYLILVAVSTIILILNIFGIKPLVKYRL